MLQRSGHQRFGLLSNPFQDLSSEGMEEAEMLHVDQVVDDNLRAVKEAVLEHQRKAVVAIIGPMGTGKTQRLKVIVNEAERLGAYVAFQQMTDDMAWTIAGTVEAMREAAGLSGLRRIASAPGWYRRLGALEKVVKRRYDPVRVGRTLAEALNAKAPAFLLLNDVHELKPGADVDRFLQTMQVITDHIKPGVMVVMTSYVDAFQTIIGRHASLLTRMDRVFTLEPLSDEDAILLLAKRIPAKRIVDDLDPLYPFTEEAVAAMNQAAGQNARRLLRLADLSLEEAVRSRAFRISVEIVENVVQRERSQRQASAARRPDGPAPSPPAPRPRAVRGSP